jgi:ribosome biogenesis GTPase A
MLKTHMSKFGWVSKKVIDKSDILLEILDARFVNETINWEMELTAKREHKLLIRVVNKSDFLNSTQIAAIKKQIGSCIFVSSVKHTGISSLRRKLKTLAKQNNLSDVVVGVLGYPNVGKSSLINVLNGRNSTSKSPEPGHTKGMQIIRLEKGILLLDTPGVMPREKKDEHELVLIGAKSPERIKDPDIAVTKLLNENPGMIEKLHGVKVNEDKEETIKDIAIKLNMKKKGNLPDIDRASRKILQDWLKMNS